MLTNEQRAHELAMLNLKVGIPVFQKNFSQKELREFNIAEMYVEMYKNALAFLNKQLTDETK